MSDTMAEEVVRLREQLAAVTRERDAMDGMYRHHAAVALDAIEKLNSAERILAALREPSEAVIDAAHDEWAVGYGMSSEVSCIIAAIRAAVAAAEREVNDA